MTPGNAGVRATHAPTDAQACLALPAGTLASAATATVPPGFYARLVASMSIATV